MRLNTCGRIKKSRSLRERIELLVAYHPRLIMRRQRQFLFAARSTGTYQEVTESEERLRKRRHLNKLYISDPSLLRELTVLSLDQEWCADLRKSPCRMAKPFCARSRTGICAGSCGGRSPAPWRPVSVWKRLRNPFPLPTEAASLPLRTCSLPFS